MTIKEFFIQGIKDAQNNEPIKQCQHAAYFEGYQIGEIDQDKEVSHEDHYREFVNPSCDYMKGKGVYEGVVG